MATKTTSLQHAEELARMHVDFFNQRNFAEAERHVTQDCEWTFVPLDRVFRGPQGYRDAQQHWLNAFPDGKCEVSHVIAQGNLAVVEFRGRGTHTGTFDAPQGKIAPTGKRVDMPFVDVYEFKNDKLWRGRTYFDSTTMMRQLGVKP